MSNEISSQINPVSSQVVVEKDVDLGTEVVGKASAVEVKKVGASDSQANRFVDEILAEKDDAEVREILVEIADDLNKNSSVVNNSKILFSVDDIADKMVISVVDKKTEELIKQFPTEEFLAMVHHLRQVDQSIFGTNSNAAGLLLHDIV